MIRGAKLGYASLFCLDIVVWDITNNQAQDLFHFLFFRPLKIKRNFVFGCVLVFPMQSQVPQIIIEVG